MLKEGWEGQIRELVPYYSVTELARFQTSILFLQTIAKKRKICYNWIIKYFKYMHQ